MNSNDTGIRLIVLGLLIYGAGTILWPKLTLKPAQATTATADASPQGSR